LLVPDEVSSTLWPVFLQAVRAACRRLVSSDAGGEERCEVLNCAESAWQAAG